jgi:hypothetical protein
MNLDQEDDLLILLQTEGVKEAISLKSHMQNPLIFMPWTESQN